MYLPIGVGDTDIIQINQGNLAYTATHQGLSHPGAYTTDTHYTDMSIAQGLCADDTIQAYDATKALIKAFILIHGV